MNAALPLDELRYYRVAAIAGGVVGPPCAAVSGERVSAPRSARALTAKSAEDDLMGLLRHNDDRVRRAATNALLKLGTTDALKGIYEAVNDKSPEVRLQATAAISTRRDAKTANTLIKAIEDEDDVDVQLAMIAALGKVATPDAITKLVKMAQPEGRLFKKKTASLRVAAVQALGDARTPAALNALKELADDKDREVRDAANRAIAQSAR